MTLHQVPATSCNHVKVLEILYANYVEMLLNHERQPMKQKLQTTKAKPFLKQYFVT